MRQRWEEAATKGGGNCGDRHINETKQTGNNQRTCNGCGRRRQWRAAAIARRRQYGNGSYGGNRTEVTAAEIERRYIVRARDDNPVGVDSLF